MELVLDMAVANWTLEYVTVSKDGRVQHVLFRSRAAHLMLIVETGIEAFALLRSANVGLDGLLQIVPSLVH